MPPKIALMIDAENISYKVLPRILDILPLHGQIVLQAIYGDWEQDALKTWHDIAEHHKFTFRHQTNAKDAKNAADMKLIMDAMDVLHYRTDVDIFCLVTNDADYVPLCNKIHEANKYLIGMGYRNAANRLVRSCDQFIFIGGKQPVSKKVVSKPPTRKEDLPALVVKAFSITSVNKDGWVNLSGIGGALGQIEGGFRTKRYGYSKLSSLFKNLPDLVEIRKRGGVSYVRLKKDSALTQDQLKEELSAAFELVPHNANGWVTLSAIGAALRKARPGFEPKHYGNARLSRLLEVMPGFIELRLIDGVQFARLRKASL